MPDRFNSKEFKALLIAGDFDAWAEVFLYIKSRLVRYIDNTPGGGVKCRWEAEELCQDVFVNILKSFDAGRSHYDGRSDPRRYFFRIAHNATINHLKKKRRSPQVTVDETRHDDSSNARSEDPPDPRANPEKDYEEKEVREIIKSQIKVLPFMYGEPLRQSFYERLKYSEIALILKISEKLVCARKTRALERLKRRLEPYFTKLKEWEFRGLFVSERPEGCVVEKVSGAVARKKASFKPDDIIKGVGDKPVFSVNDFARSTNEVEASKDVMLVVIRVNEGNKEMAITLPGASNGKGGGFKK